MRASTATSDTSTSCRTMPRFNLFTTCAITFYMCYTVVMFSYAVVDVHASPEELDTANEVATGPRPPMHIQYEQKQQQDTHELLHEENTNSIHPQDSFANHADVFVMEQSQGILQSIQAQTQSLASSSASGSQEDEEDSEMVAARLAIQTIGNRSTWTAKDHHREIERLQGIRDNAQKEVVRLQDVFQAIDQLYREEMVTLENKLAAFAVDIRTYEPRKLRPDLECLGWKQTGGCSPYGSREPDQDKECHNLVSGGMSGYCEMRDPSTDQHFRVMQLNCSSVRGHVMFSCEDATDFANFGLMSGQKVVEARNTPANELRGSIGSGDGIVMVVYPKLMTSAYATIKHLRSQNCTLPIELWVLESEAAGEEKMTTLLRVLEEKYSPVIVHTITDTTVNGFNTKIHAIYHSAFENVLFLDADNVPVRDPTYLFDTPEFQKNSAMFWPDFWHPKNTIFNIHDTSLLWQLVDTTPVDMFEQESGQILINRRKSAVALEILQFYALHKPNHFEKLVLAHGDKDLFRLAWLKTETPFYMVPYPPASAGPLRLQIFCGMTMVQYDPYGEIIFLHRNAKKLSGTDEEFWTHLQWFDWSQPSDQVDTSKDEQDDDDHPAGMMSYQDIQQKYIIAIQSSGALFKEFGSCYGAEHGARKHFKLTQWKALPFPDIEKTIISYAHEAALFSEDAPIE